MQVHWVNRKLVVGVSHDDKVWRWTGSGWEELPGRLTWVSIGKDGDMWGVSRDHAIWHWVSGGWHKVDGGAVQISVGDSEHIALVAPDDVPFKWNGHGWEVGVRSLRVFCVCGSYRSWLRASSSFGVRTPKGSICLSPCNRVMQRLPGALKRISISAHGHHMAGVSGDEKIWLWDGEGSSKSLYQSVSVRRTARRTSLLWSRV